MHHSHRGQIRHVQVTVGSRDYDIPPALVSHVAYRVGNSIVCDASIGIATIGTVTIGRSSVGTGVIVNSDAEDEVR